MKTSQAHEEKKPKMKKKKKKKAHTGKRNAS
jgi:hypothetical protein